METKIKNLIKDLDQRIDLLNTEIQCKRDRMTELLIVKAELSELLIENGENNG